MSDPAFRERLRRKALVKFREIMDGCTECDPDRPCPRHGELMDDMTLRPRRYARSWDLPGDEIHPEDGPDKEES